MPAALCSLAQWRVERPGLTAILIFSLHLGQLRNAHRSGCAGLRWFALEQELTKQLGCPVDMVTENALSPHLRAFIEQEQVVLYEEE
jgi:hypothetical protein